MRLRVIVSDTRPEILAIWRNVFRDENAFEIRLMTARDLMRMPEIDAALMLGMFAHEHYGGGPIIGVSQILSTHSEPGMSPWVVTTPPFAAHIEKL